MLYPLKFRPCLKFYPYGGRRFAEVLRIDDVPTDRDVAETWEIADHGEEQSLVVNGEFTGKSLRKLMQQFGEDLVGKEVYDRYGNYFPLLLKFLDCDKRLPAHMHPNDHNAARLGLKDKGKTEAWYIVKADEGAGAYIGMLPEFTPEKFAAAIERGDTYDGVMKKVATQTGETYFCSVGPLAWFGRGNLAFEIQQNSDAGFGWDWAGFVEAGVISPEDAKAHPKFAIECAYYEDGVREITQYVSIKEQDADRTFCCACQYFVLERWTASSSIAFHDDADRFNTFTVIDGSATFAGGGQEVEARFGQSLLIPAGLEVTITPQNGEVTILRCYVPELQRDVIEVLRAHGKSDEEIAWLGSYGQGNDLLPHLNLPQEQFGLKA